MTKTISKIGNSQGIIFDAALMDLARVKLGDQMTVTVHDGGSIILTPVRSAIEAKEAAQTARRVIKKNSTLFKRLA
jgi:antitoxin component of MazEF toxin-antitoxin module